MSPAPALARTGPAPLGDDGLRSAPQLPPHRQIADAVVRSTGGVVEITLAPVELGRLTVVIGTSGAGPRLGVIAERPETLELIRRHSDMLIRDLRDSGLPDAQLSFQRSDAPERPSQAGSTAGWHAQGSTGEQAHGLDTRGGAPDGQSEGESRPRGARRGSADDADQIIPASAPSRPFAGSHGRLDIRV
ncbi:flagellar hook-length control protein FliK [Paracoccus endophyticus]|uniref:flagellar hook-length control protein FliK n=1 Tax=Paracoccus endophyticus TaxID=2233774 RepID=UPI0013A6B43F|nr:flagellar hook-length control protein FliK [Paracoccus endophyticus]